MGRPWMVMVPKAANSCWTRTLVASAGKPPTNTVVGVPEMNGDVLKTLYPALEPLAGLAPNPGGGLTAEKNYG